MIFDESDLYHIFILHTVTVSSCSNQDGYSDRVSQLVMMYEKISYAKPISVYDGNVL